MSPENTEYNDSVSPTDNVQMQENIDLSAMQRTRNWVNAHKWQLAVAGIATSACLTFASDKGHEAFEDAKDHLPAVGIGMVAMEAMWIGGAGMMAASVGNKIKNPLKIRQQFPEIAKQANHSKLFTAGFWTNTAGAVGEFVIPTAVVCSKLPPETWGVLGPSLVDLGITLAVRKAILNGVRSADAPKQANPTTEF